MSWQLNHYRVYLCVKGIKYEHHWNRNISKSSITCKLLAIDDAKEKEIDRQIQKLKNIKTVMQEKKEKIVLCETL